LLDTLWSLDALWLLEALSVLDALWLLEPAAVAPASELEPPASLVAASDGSVGSVDVGSVLAVVGSVSVVVGSLSVVVGSGVVAGAPESVVSVGSPVGSDDGVPVGLVVGSDDGVPVGLVVGSEETGCEGTSGDDGAVVVGPVGDAVGVVVTMIGTVGPGLGLLVGGAGFEATTLVGEPEPEPVPVPVLVPVPVPVPVLVTPVGLEPGGGVLATVVGVVLAGGADAVRKVDAALVVGVRTGDAGHGGAGVELTGVEGRWAVLPGEGAGPVRATGWAAGVE
jgi:hypothetical protein